MSFPNGLYSDLYRKTILGYTTPSAQVNWAKSIKLRKKFGVAQEEIRHEMNLLCCLMKQMIEVCH